MQKLLFFIIFLFVFTAGVHAASNPLKFANNKIGIHILFDYELEAAADFVNSSGGQWGYVTIPIQIGDRDLIKWQSFMDRARMHQIIPIVRLASEGDYFNTKVWKKPSAFDIIDFANFLDSLAWPTKNRYIVIFNEPNRYDEWGGSIDPADYANLLSFAVNVFKSKTQDFFIISAGMDNAAPQQPPYYMNEYSFLRSMDKAVPGIFNQIDGISSHSYPNPGFSQPPDLITDKSIHSFKFERELVNELSNKDIPVFITETGWNAPHLTDEIKASYYSDAFSDVWSDPGIVAVTPFILHAGDGPFKGFSFLKSDGNPSLQMETLLNIPKVKGQPILAPIVLGSEKQLKQTYPVKNFTHYTAYKPSNTISILAQRTFKWMMKL